MIEKNKKLVQNQVTVKEYREGVWHSLKRIEDKLDDVNGRVRKNEKDVSLIKGVGIAITAVLGILATVGKKLIGG